MSIKNKLDKSEEKAELSEKLEKSEDFSNKKEISLKKYVALKTIKITANRVFNLIEGEEIPKEIDKNFIQSLISSKLIKLIK